MAHKVSPALSTGPRPGAPGLRGDRFRVAGTRRPPFRGNLAALDLGTNNCRLLIARPEGDDFIIVDAFSRIVRLGEGLAATGYLSEAAVERTISALSVCADKLCRRRVTLARSVATEACRQAENGAEFVERVHRETGIMLDIISTREEARLAVIGCHALLEGGDGPALIFDIGGGSTELAVIEGRGASLRIIDWLSAPYGVVSLAEAVPTRGEGPADRAAAYAEMREVMREAFAGFAARLETREGGLRLLGTSGTVTTLASVHLGLARYDRQAVDGLIVPSAAMRDIAQRLSTMSIAERVALPCIGDERADLVVAGCAILEAILDIWPAERLGVADRGIREGILRSLLNSATNRQLR